MVNQHLLAILIQNAVGIFVAPSIAEARAAISAFETMPTGLRFYVVKAEGAAAHSLAEYSWVVIYQKQNDAERGKARRRSGG